MSAPEELFHAVLKDTFPNARIHSQYYVNVGRVKVFFDFFIPAVGVAVEIHGQQHYEFNKFYHRSKWDFLHQKNRDNLKALWCNENDVVLLEIKHDELPKTSEELLDLILTAQRSL